MNARPAPSPHTRVVVWHAQHEPEHTGPVRGVGWAIVAGVLFWSAFVWLAVDKAVRVYGEPEMVVVARVVR